MVFSKATGVVCWDDVVDHMDRLESHPDFRPEFNQLVDIREASRTDLSHNDVRRMAERRIFSDKSRRAFVVSRDFEFGLSRVFATYREIRGETGIEVFRDMKKALSWLSLTEEPDPGMFTRLKPSQVA